MRKLYLDLKINGKLASLEPYKATLVGNGFTPSAPTINKQQSLRGVREIIDKEFNFNPDEVFLQFKVNGIYHEETDYLMRKLVGDLVNFDFRLSSQNYWRTFIQTSVELQWLNYEKEVVVTLRGSSYCWGFNQSMDILKNGQEVLIDTPRPTPLIYEITALDTVSNLKLDEMTILSLSKGEKMVIDSYYCKVTVGAENAINRVNIYEFPLAKGIHKVEVSDLTKVSIKLTWRPRL